MLSSLLQFVYPKSCHICRRHGQYICDTCKKTFKRNLPECYVCRRLSPNYNTHTHCKSTYSLDQIVVGWEYNKISSKILKSYKYRGAWDIGRYLAEFLIQSLGHVNFKDTLFTSVPISFLRRNERGFNQTELLLEIISKYYSCDFSADLVGRKTEKGHQSLRNRESRLVEKSSDFYIKDEKLLGKYNSVTILDDVITTGHTLECISKTIKDNQGYNYTINALCLFRGKPYYSVGRDG